MSRSQSKAERSGDYWLRAAMTLLCLSAAILFGLSQVHADEQKPTRNLSTVTALAPAKLLKPAVAPAVTWETQAAVTHRVTAFDFNAASEDVYGDQEPAR
jgi:hypothetical protein